MNLTLEDAARLAAEASWKIEVWFGLSPGGMRGFGESPGSLTSDPVVWPGKGIADIDWVENWMRAYPRARWRIDVGRAGGGIGGYDKWILIGLEDMERLRAAYLAIWGDVNRPPMIDPDDRPPSVIPVPDGVVTV